MPLTKKEQLKNVEEFFKAAFCVDGEAKFLHNKQDFKIIGVVELNDSKRGKFYIAKVESK